MSIHGAYTEQISMDLIVGEEAEKIKKADQAEAKKRRRKKKKTKMKEVVSFILRPNSPQKKKDQIEKEQKEKELKERQERERKEKERLQQVQPSPFLSALGAKEATNRSTKTSARDGF